MQTGIPFRAKRLAIRLQPRVAALMQNRFFLSGATHTIILTIALNAWWFGAKHMKPAGSRHGVQVMLVASTGSPAPPAPAQHSPAPPKHTAAHNSKAMAAPAPEAESAPPAEALGDGPATILYIQAFPAHPPQMSGGDLTRDLIVDIQIDETGHVRQTHKERGMGTNVDDVIIATLQQWIFQPAIRSGKPIPSVQELHFRFDARRNPACGWECIQLLAN
jgi:protein TonB